MVFPVGSTLQHIDDVQIKSASAQVHRMILSKNVKNIFKHKGGRTQFLIPAPRGGGGYSHTLPIQVCAAQQGRDFEAPDLERGIHYRGVF